MAWPHIYICRAAKTVTDFRNGLKSDKVQNEHMFFALSSITCCVTGGSRPDARMPTQWRLAKSLRLKERR